VKHAVAILFSLLLVAFLSCVACPQATAQITITSANPNSAAQGTVNLNVTVNGNGFKKGAKAQWFVTGTTNPGGVTVNSTGFNNSNQLTANITVAVDAATAKFDIQVTNADGRTGKGTELFAVQSSGNTKASCTSVPVNPVPNACVSSTASTACLDSTFGNGGLVLTSTTSSEPVAVKQQTDGKLVAIGQINDSSSQSIEIVRYNADGSLDTSFGSSGIVKDFSFPGGVCCYGTFDGAIDQNGNILVLGQSPNGNFVRRYTPSGVPDADFNAKSLSSFFSGISSKSLRLQPDGKLLITGSYFPPKGKGSVEAFVMRLNNDGTSDSSFGSGGLSLLSTFPTSKGLAIQTINSQQYIIAGGTSSSNDFGLVRLTPAGTLDATFGSNGLANTSYCTGSAIYSVAVDNSGGILAAGLVQLTQNGVHKIEVARYTSAGVLDTTFGDPSNSSSGRTGITVLDTFGYKSDVASIVPVFDGTGNLTHIMVAGDGSEQAGTGSIYNYLILARYNPDGSLDSTFGSGGVTAANFGNNNNYVMQLPASNLAIQSNGEYVIIGGATTLQSGDNYSFGVARYWP
jgi:uncharacterized delta-60 repeat protein